MGDCASISNINIGHIIRGDKLKSSFAKTISQRFRLGLIELTPQSIESYPHLYGLYLLPG